MNSDIQRENSIQYLSNYRDDMWMCVIIVIIFVDDTSAYSKTENIVSFNSYVVWWDLLGIIYL